MRRGILALTVLSVLLLSASGHGQTANVSFETVTFTNASTGFTAGTLTPDGQPVMTWCSGKLETAQIRYRYDGTAPTTTVGALLDINDVLTISGRAYLLAFRGIRTTGTSGVIHFHCTALR